MCGPSGSSLVDLYLIVVITGIILLVIVIGYKFTHIAMHNRLSSTKY